MHKRDRSPAALAAGLVAGAVVGTGLVLSSAGPAQAAAAGTITVSPNTGAVDRSPMFDLATTSAPCPAAYNASVALKIGPTAGPFKNLAQVGFAGEYDKQPVSLVPNKSFTKALGTVTPGDYLLILVCGNAQNVEAPQRFETKVTVAGSTWTAESEAATSAPTTTALAVTPAGQAPKGSPVTMTATVSPVTAVGAVTFRSGNGVIGTPVPVAQGVATLTVSSLVAGPNQLSASFGPTDLTAFLPSTSAVVTYQINAPSPSPSPSPSSPSASPSPSVSKSPSPSASPSESPSTPPTDEPTDEPTDDPTPSDSPSPSPSPTLVNGSGGGGNLPTTGPAVAYLAAAGVGLMVSGIAAMFMTRRRTRP